MHTRGQDERVWTLPTGLLALAEFRWGRLDQAIKQLHNIALTTHHGMLGSFEELIPAGLCFIQLWSAAVYVQGIVEGVLGLDPRAHEHRLRLQPQLGDTWPWARLRNLRVGQHTLHIAVERRSTTITHTDGWEPLTVEYLVSDTPIREVEIRCAPSSLVSVQRSDREHCVVCTLDPGREVTMTFGVDGDVQVEYTGGTVPAAGADSLVS
jgi:hypothetical protein